MKKRNPYFHYYNFDDICFYGFVAFSIVVLILSMYGCWPVQDLNDALGVSDDNPAEQLLEGVIEHNTGVSLDLSPRSPP